MSDVIKRFKNQVVLAGKLAELETPKYGTDKNGRDYVSVRGAIQCGETGIYLRHFESYINATKKDGTDSKLYSTMTDWLSKAVPMTKDKENPTMVEMTGSWVDNPYVSADEELKEGSRYSMQFINDFTEYKCNINIEGIVSKPTPEVVNEKDTGRYRIEVLSSDTFGNIIKVKNVFIPADMVNDFIDSGYEDGNVLGMLYLSYIPSETVVKKKGGFGEQRQTDGQTRFELTLVGGETAEELSDDDDNDNPDIVTRDMVKRMKVARKERLQEVKDAGYQGSKKSATSAPKKGFGNKASTSKKASKVEDEEDDDDMPF